MKLDGPRRDTRCSLAVLSVSCAPSRFNALSISGLASRLLHSRSRGFPGSRRACSAGGRRCRWRRPSRQPRYRCFSRGQAWAERRRQRHRRHRHRRRRRCCCRCRCCCCASPRVPSSRAPKRCRSRACMGNTRPGAVRHSTAAATHRARVSASLFGPRATTATPQHGSRASAVIHPHPATALHAWGTLPPPLQQRN